MMRYCERISAAGARYGWTLAAAFFVGLGCAPTEPDGTAPDANASNEAAIPIEVPVMSAADAAAALAEARGSIAVVNFWATWCGPCVAEMPELAEFHTAYSPRGVQFFSLSVDHPDTLDDRVRPFIREHQLPFPVIVLDAPNPDVVDEAFGLEVGGAVPATAVFGADGTLARAWYEQVDYETLATAVDRLLDPSSAD